MISLHTVKRKTSRCCKSLIMKAFSNFSKCLLSIFLFSIVIILLYAPNLNPFIPHDQSSNLFRRSHHVTSYDNQYLNSFFSSSSSSRNSKFAAKNIPEGDLTNVVGSVNLNGANILAPSNKLNSLNSKYDPFNYGIVIDCGSSGSRVFVYKWDPLEIQQSVDKTFKQVTVPQDKILLHGGKSCREIECPVVKKVEPGISRFVKEPEKAADQIEQLVSFADFFIPKDKKKTTVLYIYATAGMRMAHKSERNNILRGIRHRISINFKEFILENPEMISGETEGLYAWLAINSIKGTLCPKIPNPFNAENALAKNSIKFRSNSLAREEALRAEQNAVKNYQNPKIKAVAVMDMGGGSMQIVIPMNETQTKAMRARFANSSDVHASSLNSHIKEITYLPCQNQKLNVFIKTWLGLGANTARQRYEDFLLKDGEVDPCVNHGLSLNSVTGIQGNFEKCREKLAGRNIFRPSEIELENSLSDISQKFEGIKVKSPKKNKGLLECFKTDQNKQDPTQKDILCGHGINNKQLPNIDFREMELIGLSEFFYTTHDTFQMSGEFDAEEFHRKADLWCSTSGKFKNEGESDELLEDMPLKITNNNSNDTNPQNNKIESSDHPSLIQTDHDLNQNEQSLSDLHEKFSIEEAQQSRIESQCFKAAWMSTVLYEGLGFPILEKDKFRLIAIDRFEHQDLQWTLGALIHQVLTKPEKHGLKASSVSKIPSKAADSLKEVVKQAIGKIGDSNSKNSDTSGNTKTKNKNLISNDQQNKDILNNNKKSNNDDPPNTFEIINEKLLSNRPANSEKMHMLGEYQNQDRALSLTFYFTLCIISFIVVYYIVILFNSSRFYRTRFGWSRNEDYVRMI